MRAVNPKLTADESERAASSENTVKPATAIVRRPRWKAAEDSANNRALSRSANAQAAAVADRQRQLALAPRIITATTQSDALARLLSIGPETVTFALSILLALSLDLGPGIGLTIATVMLGADKPSRRTAPKVRPSKVPPSDTGKVQVPRSGARSQPKVRPATERSDIEGFVSVRDRTIKDGTTTAAELFDALQTYWASRGLAPISQRAFGDIMRRLGFEKDRRTASGCVRYLGLTLVEEVRAAA